MAAQSAEELDTIATDKRWPNIIRLAGSRFTANAIKSSTRILRSIAEIRSPLDQAARQAHENEIRFRHCFYHAASIAGRPT